MKPTTALLALATIAGCGGSTSGTDGKDVVGTWTETLSITVSTLTLGNQAVVTINNTTTGNLSYHSVTTYPSDDAMHAGCVATDDVTGNFNAGSGSFSLTNPTETFGQENCTDPTKNVTSGPLSDTSVATAKLSGPYTVVGNVLTIMGSRTQTYTKQ
jgi:hypothetical protein